MELWPCDRLEKTLRIMKACLGFAGIPWWMSFGGLYALVKNRGIIPDGDLDLCCMYGTDYTRLVKSLEGRGYRMSKCLVNDTDPSQALYCGFNHLESGNDCPKCHGALGALPDGSHCKACGGSGKSGPIHICLSFWFPHSGKRWYCHDQNKEVHGVGVPPSGYFFKGVPAEVVEDELFFRYVEWPGINGEVKVRVPMLAGTMLDNLYPFWPYKWQRYNVDAVHTIEDEKLSSVFKGGATSRFKVHVDSMAQWENAQHVSGELEKAGKAYRAEVKKWQKSFK